MLPALLTFGLLQPAVVGAEKGQELRTVTNLTDWWQLTASQQRTRCQLDVEYLVVVFDPEWRNLWGINNGLCYYLDVGTKPLDLRPGQRVRLTGTVETGKNINTDELTIEVLGASPVPAPRPANGRLESVAELNSQWIQVEGYVDTQQGSGPTHQNLEVIADGWRMSVVVVNKPGELLPSWEGSRVRLNGVYLPATTPDGRIASLVLRVHGTENVTPLGRLADDPRFAEKVWRAEEITNAAPGQWVHLLGELVSQDVGKTLTLRDPTGEVTIDAAQNRALRLGEMVEAIAQVERAGADISLVRGLYMLSKGGLIGEPSRQRWLRLAEQVISLSPAEARSGKPVRVSGVVSWAHPQASYFYLLDASRGVRVVLPEKASPPQPGDSVVVNGVTRAGQYAPEVAATELTVTRGMVDVRLPPARPVTLEQAQSGVEEGRWIEMLGYVRAHRVEGPWSRLTLSTSGGEFDAVLPATPHLDSLVSAVIRARGVSVAQANDRHQLTGIELWVPAADQLRLEESAPADPFSVPLVSVASLRQFNSLQSTGHRIRIAATVVHHRPGSLIYARQDDENFRILASDTSPLRPGDQIEAVGFPQRQDSALVLRESVYRKTGAGQPPEPIALTDASVLDPGIDGYLVRLDAVLLERVRGEGADRLVLQSRDRVFDALLPDAQPIADLEQGSALRATGIYHLIRDESRKAQSFQLQVRSRDDLTVVAAPPWWNARRALSIAAFFGCACAIGFTWVRLLRKRVRTQTAQIHAQLARVAHLEARHRGIIENASDFIFTADLSGQVTSFNPAGERMTGLTREEALRRNVRDLISPEDLSAGVPILNLAAQQDGSATFQCRFRKKDGSLVWVETSACLLREDGKPAGLLGVVRDISERKKIEEELRRARDTAEANARAKSAFLANMSHEIRTPMNGVIGMSNLLLDTELSREQRDFAETIRNSAESLLTVLNDILDFSKIEAGKLQFETLDFDLVECVESTLDLLSVRAAGKGLELASFIETDLPAHVRGDSGRLRQVLLNLVGNAVKFTDRGEVVVRATRDHETATHLRIRFEVTDTGIGMSEEAQANLFQPFMQADSSTTRRFGGTGLGLAICRQIVEMLRGEIGVRSRLGEGSTFWFTVTFEKRPPLAQTDPAGTEERARRALSEIRTAVVDDNATNRTLLQKYLASWGVDSELFSSGEAALAGMRRAADQAKPFGLVLLDFHMPVMDGLRVAEQIRQDPSLCDARCLLLTSLDHRFDRTELRAHGIERAMTKPIRKAELHAAILGLLSVPNEEGLPARTPARPEPPSLPPSLRGLRILVAEDNVVNQRVARLQLEKMGHRAELANNGFEAIEALKQAPFDLILMDCQMPELDGYEATRRIRRELRQADIPIVAMTANAMEGDRDLCLTAGMNDYVSKPVRLQELVAVLERLQPVLERRKALRTTRAPFGPPGGS